MKKDVVDISYLSLLNLVPMFESLYESLTYDGASSDYNDYRPFAKYSG